MSRPTCPKCGYGLGPQLAFTRMLTCPSCGTTLFLKDDVFTEAGSAGVMHDMPLLFGLGDTIEIDGARGKVLGHARFSYGRGSWDEFWTLDADGRGAWISVDEGDVVWQRQLTAGAPDATAPPDLGTNVSCNGTDYAVTEAETATCEALRGAFPEVLTVGERYAFVNCTSESGDLLSGEFWPGGRVWYLGAWVDPYDVHVVEPAGAA